MTLINDYNINSNKINNWLDELNNDRNKLFNDVKQEKEKNIILEAKIKTLEDLQRQLIKYKNILIKEKNSK